MAKVAQGKRRGSGGFIDLARDLHGKWYRLDVVAEALGLPFAVLHDACKHGTMESLLLGGPTGYLVQLDTVQAHAKSLARQAKVEA